MKKHYDWKKTVKKGGIESLILLAAVVAAYAGNNMWLLALAPLAKVILNVYKHK